MDQNQNAMSVQPLEAWQLLVACRYEHKLPDFKYPYIFPQSHVNLMITTREAEIADEQLLATMDSLDIAADQATQAVKEAGTLASRAPGSCIFALLVQTIRGDIVEKQSLYYHLNHTLPAGIFLPI